MNSETLTVEDSTPAKIWPVGSGFFSQGLEVFLGSGDRAPGEPWNVAQNQIDDGGDGGRAVYGDHMNGPEGHTSYKHLVEAAVASSAIQATRPATPTLSPSAGCAIPALHEGDVLQP